MASSLWMKANGNFPNLKHGKKVMEHLLILSGKKI
jgi:hypothetical protein